MDEEDFSNVIGTDTSFGEATVAASVAATPDFAPDPQTGPIGPNAPDLTSLQSGQIVGGFLRGFTGPRRLPSVFSPIPGVTLNRNQLLRQATIRPVGTEIKGSATFGLNELIVGGVLVIVGAIIIAKLS